MSTPLVEPEAPSARLRVKAEHVLYLAVGGWNTVFATAVFAVLERVVGLHYMAALVATQVIGTLNAFLTYRYIVFRVRGHFFADLGRFSLVYVGAFAFNLVALPVLVEGAGLDPLLVQVLIVGVTVVSSYIGHKRFSFRRQAGA